MWKQKTALNSSHGNSKTFLIIFKKWKYCTFLRFMDLLLIIRYDFSYTEYINKTPGWRKCIIRLRAKSLRSLKTEVARTESPSLRLFVTAFLWAEPSPLFSIKFFLYPSRSGNDVPFIVFMRCSWLRSKNVK